jgi:Flp pilus assembly protein protease CpaA
VNEFVAKLLVSALFTLLIKGGVALFGHWIAWWLAALIALVVVFGGFLFLGDSDGAWE